MNKFPELKGIKHCCVCGSRDVDQLKALRLKYYCSTGPCSTAGGAK